MTTEIARMSALDLLSRFRTRELSPVEATRAALDCIAEGDPRLNAFCRVDAEAALRQARASEARWRKNEPAGLLDGIPVSIKDLVLAAGWPTLRGSLTIARDQAWDEDAPAVARLREHGAVLLGKTTTPEFGWKGATDSLLTGITRNPWNNDLTPGGSSGGAAVALASGMGALAIGTDGAGSIRIPASFTGVFGLKATNGVVPAHPPSPIGTLANAGPMARTVADCALMLGVIGRFDPRDPHAQPVPAPDYLTGLDDGVAGLRIAFSPDFGHVRVHAEVADCVARAVQALEGQGAKVEIVDLPMHDAVDAVGVLWPVGNAHGLRSLSTAQRALLDPGLLAMAAAAEGMSALSYLAAVSARERVQIRMNKLFAKFDLLVTPTMPMPAFPVGRPAPEPADEGVAWSAFTYPFNLTMQPAASAPCGFTSAGLPVGLQIVGQRFADALVLRAARAYERVAPFRMPWDGIAPLPSSQGTAGHDGAAR